MERLRWKDIGQRIQRLAEQRKLAQEQVRREQEALQQTQEELTAHLQAQTVLQEAAEAAQHQAHERISEMVTECLRSVFGESTYSFRIVNEVKRGKTESRLVFARDGVELDPLSSAGGGVIDVAAMALRLVTLTLMSPQRRNLLVLDEPFRFVSREYLPLIVDLLERLADQMEIQILMVTHIEVLSRAGTTHEISR